MHMQKGANRHVLKCWHNLNIGGSCALSPSLECSSADIAHFDREVCGWQVAWTPTHVVMYPAICSLAGLVAGMFGVGGGIVKVSVAWRGCETGSKFSSQALDLQQLLCDFDCVAMQV